MKTKKEFVTEGFSFAIGKSNLKLVIFLLSPTPIWQESCISTLLMQNHVPTPMKCLACAYCEGGSCPKFCAFRVNEQLRPGQIAKKPGLSLGWVFVRLCYHELGITAPWSWGAICLQVVQKRKGEMPFPHDFKIYCHLLCMYKNHMSVTAPNIEINLSCKTCRSAKDMTDQCSYLLLQL